MFSIEIRFATVCAGLAATLTISACDGGATPQPADPIATRSQALSITDAGAAPDFLPIARPGPVDPALTVDDVVRPLNGMNYHDGGVMLEPKRIYYIWYGDWPDTSTTPAILNDLAANIGGSPYFSIVSTYSDGAGHPISNRATFGGGIKDNYSRGNALTGADVWGVVSAAIASGRLPSDPNGVYFVLTSADVSEASFRMSFCDGYCAWHLHALQGNDDIKYVFVGDPARCPPDWCHSNKPSVNDNPSADNMASIIAHELTEAVTDPSADGKGWSDVDRRECADGCDFMFGEYHAGPNGGATNIRLGNRQYLIQENYLLLRPQNGYCAMWYTCPANPCGARQCGTTGDGCGNTVACGTCGPQESCVGGLCQCNARPCAKGFHFNPDSCTCERGLPG